MPANIFPSEIPEEVLADPKREGERIVYEILSDSMEGFTVFYNCYWSHEGETKIKDGEADFIVSHPYWGFVVLEIKGGVVSRDEDGNWSSRNKLGQTFKIKDPVRQARDSKYVILEKIKDAWKGQKPWLNAKHGVLLPESGRPRDGKALGADMPLDIFGFAEDLDNLGARVQQILTYDPPGTATKYDPLGERGMRILHHLFARGFDLEISLASIIDANEKKIEELTTQQRGFLDMTANHRRLLVEGGAGTGKTMLAIEKARRLNAENQDILVLCFNQPLAAFFAHRLSDCNNVLALNFHQFCSFASKEAGIPDREEGDNKELYENVLPEMLLDALSVKDDLRYDAIIVDEGQDFLRQWWEPLLLCLNDTEEGLVYVFRDDNQNIYGGLGYDIPGMPEYPHLLTKNLRNTVPICGAAKVFYSGSELEAGGPKGMDIEWVDGAGGKALLTLEKRLNKLINIDGVAPSDIAILTAQSVKNSIFDGLDTIGRYRIETADRINTDCVTLDSIYRFKGLEKAVVVLTDLDYALNSEELLYVGLSRAKSLLILTGETVTIDKLRDRIRAD